jgi:aspartate-semialdehyde dehydrogenase
MALALAPLHERHGVRRVFAATMQAVSGAGYPGVPSLDIMGNVIPYIADEEPKIEAELLKLLGRYENDAIVAAPITVAAHANRVPVEHGHTVCMSVELEEKCTPAEAMELISAWRGYAGRLNSPTAPERPLMLTNEAARPQPRRDVFSGRGMSVLVGRVREDPIFHLRLVALGHNTIRGAAGGSVLNAECLALRGEIARA